MDTTTTWFYDYAQTLINDLPATRESDDEDFVWLS